MQSGYACFSGYLGDSSSTMAARDNPVLTTGQLDWSSGCDSQKTPTIISARNPNGLGFNQLAWLVNATMRGGSLQPRDGYNLKGNVNGNLPAQEVPGAPAQSAPQPPLPPVNTPSPQDINANTGPGGAWTVPVVGQRATVPVTTLYVGNVGDTQLVTTEFDRPNQTIGTFLIISFNSTSIVVQTISTLIAGQGVDTDMIFTVQSLGPSLPQPPIILPPGPPTIVPVAPFFQGASMYQPDSGTPYVIAVIGGHVVQIDPDFNNDPVDLSDVWGFYLPAASPRCFFVQAENYLIIQAGDYNPVTNSGTLPLFWSGSELTQSNGLTGVLSVGQEVANFFTINSTIAWTPPPVGGNVTLPLNAAYNAPNQHLGDNLVIYSQAVSPVLLGTFRVVGLSGNSITLTTLVQSSTALQPAGGLSATVVVPLTPTQSVVIGTGFFNIPAVGNQVSINLTSLYFGSVGDIITIQSEDGSITYGTFQVISFSATTFPLVLKNVGPATAYTGTQVSALNFLVTVTASRKGYFQQAQNSAYPWVVAEVGSASTFQWIGKQSSGFSFVDFVLNYPGFSGDGTVGNAIPYSGKLYDIVQLTDVVTNVIYGIFRVVEPIEPYPPFFYQVGLQTLQLGPGAQAGQSISQAHARFTVVMPPSNPQFLTLNTGQWTMPAVGGSVQLQINWLGSGDNPPEGPQYPGSVGDTVTLTQNSPVLPIGQFLVTAFDTLGNITLQAVVPTNGFTPVAAGTVIVGPLSGTMAIIQAPSQVGTLISQIPAATSMFYYQGIVFYAQGDIISGGDIVGGPSGTSANNYRDAVLCVTENPLAFGGDGFKLPIPGNITGMGVPAQINAALGQGLLYIGTINGICSLQVPSTRTAWILASGSNGPQLNIVQFGNGWTSDWAIVSINGDLYFPSVEPGIRSLLLAERWFQQQGNVQISTNESRLLRFVNSSLLNYASGIFFNNRLLMAMFPQQTAYGVVNTAVIPLDMEPLSTLEEQLPANWEGGHEGLQVFQLLTATFNGKQRAFAVTLNSITPGEIDLHEIVLEQEADTDNNDVERRITWQLETPCFTFQGEDDLKKLVGCEVWLDRIRGIVDLQMEWRVDSSTCWELWKKWTVCSARNSEENMLAPISYPITPYPPGFRQMMSLPEPIPQCQSVSKRPNNVGYQFQLRFTLTGFTRVRGLFPKGIPVDKETFFDLIC
jgi:hypothetical protein